MCSAQLHETACETALLSVYAQLYPELSHSSEQPHDCCQKSLQPLHELYSIDHRIVLPDGTVRIVHEEAEVIFDSNHEAVQMNGTVQDITERKQIEEQFRKLSHAIEQSTLSIFITDTKGNIEYANPILFDVTGYTREEAIGKTPKIFSSGKTPPETYRSLWKTILSGKD